MGVFVSNGAMITCSFGAAPSTLVAAPKAKTFTGGQPAATIVDFAPMTNILPFGMCTTLSNPTVASATAAALGVLTPMPCVPVTTPWKPGSATVFVGGIPALTNSSTCQCAWGGVITVGFPGQVTVLGG